MTSASKPGVRLDPADSDDRRIIARQVKAARQAGREGRDRARSTRGRADLEAAYDEGAAPPAPDEDQDQDEDEDEDPDQPGRPARAWQALNRGNWSSFKPSSPLTGHTRMQDASGLLTGVLLYTVVIVYVRYGAAGWKGWLSAKFLNKPMSSSAAANASGGTSKEAV